MGLRVIRWGAIGARGGTDVRRGMVTVRIPVQSPAGKVENTVECLARRGIRVEHQNAGETCRGIARAQNQVPVTSQNAHVIGVLVERMLPTSLAYGANQRLLARMHVRVAVVRLMRIF